jgi:glycosyltransferase involved in cell wall biosynthesis
MDFSIVCVYNNRKILNQYLLESLKKQTIPYELILVDGFSKKYNSAADALNSGGEQAAGRYIMFVHQDIQLGNARFLEDSLWYLDELPNLGIAGIAGKSPASTNIVSNSYNGTPPWKLSTNCIREPVMVQTLDECVLVIPRARFETTRFDPVTCNDWHLYGVDYCLTMKSIGFDVMVLPTGVYHLSDGDSMNSAYFSTLERLITKHRAGTPVITTTVGIWSTSSPVSYQKLKSIIGSYWFSFYKSGTKYLNNRILNNKIRQYLENKNGIFLATDAKEGDPIKISIGSGVFRFKDNWDEIKKNPVFHTDEIIPFGQITPYFDVLKENRLSRSEPVEIIVTSHIAERLDTPLEFLIRCTEVLKDGGILLLQVRHGENMVFDECSGTGPNLNMRNSTEEWIKIVLDAQLGVLCVVTQYPENVILLCRKPRNGKITNSRLLRKYATWRLISNFETDKLWKKEWG